MRKLPIVVLLAILLIPLALHPAQARSLNVTYHGETELIERGHQPVELKFTLRNIFNRSLDVEVSVPYSSLYSVSYKPASSFRISPHGVENVTVVITPSKHLERREIDLKVIFKIYEVEAVTPIDTKEYPITILVINPSWFIQPIIYSLGLENYWIWQFIITVLFWLGVGFLTVFVISPIIHVLTKKTKTQVDDIVWSIVKTPIIIMLFIYGFVAAAELLPISASYLSAINKLYELILISVITYLTYRIFHDLMLYEGKKLAEKTESELDDILIPVVEKIGDVIIIIVGSLWLLNSLGIDITIFLAGLGGLGLIIGLASQDALANFFAGMHILLDHPFSIGDYIKLEGINTVYRVDKVGVRSTRAYDVFNHEEVVIPNKLLAGDKIINMMKPDQLGKVKFNVSVAYGTDVEEVMKVIEDVVNEHPEIIKKGDKKPLVRLVNFGDSALDILVIAWIPNIMDQWRVAHELRIALYNRFREKGIEIPFPQLDVHIKEHS